MIKNPWTDPRWYTHEEAEQGTAPARARLRAFQAFILWLEQFTEEGV